MKDMLNIGCGSRFHQDWVNLDLQPQSPKVTKANIQNGIPFPDESFDVIYHSHMLEHLPKDQANEFLDECFRVLRPGGIIRVVVPDLEAIVREYLKCLGEATEGLPGSQDKYDWVMLELYDQLVRDKSGGGMKSFLQNRAESGLDFPLERCGAEVKQIVDFWERKKNLAAQVRAESRFHLWMKKVVNLLRKPHLLISRTKESFIKFLLGTEFQALMTGRFHESGELHKWMYDRHSLSKLLGDIGFINSNVLSATESRIQKWNDFQLDAGPDGVVHKPDSMFMEARKPEDIQPQ